MPSRIRLLTFAFALLLCVAVFGLKLPGIKSHSRGKTLSLGAGLVGLATDFSLAGRAAAYTTWTPPLAPMTYTVTTLSDSGPGSLRQAILDANANMGADTITFQAGLTGTITLTTGELAISDSVTIQGPGARLLTVSGNNASRVFFVDFSVTATINDLTVANGNGVGTTSSGTGGGLLNQGTLTLNRSVVAGNTASFGGGGLTNHPVATLTVRESTISGNTTTKAGSGGGIENSGTLHVINSTISGNQANNSGGSNSGGIWSVNGSATIVNSTITGNAAAGSNSAGGVRLGSGSVTLKNTIVAGNTGTSGATADVNNQGGGTFTSGGANLIGQNNGATASFPAGNPNANQDIVGTSGSPLNPRLGPLQNNGGPTDTHRPLSGSPVIDQGKAATDPVTSASLTVDQRGFPRPVDTVLSNLTGGNGSDIGAVELRVAESGGEIQLATNPATDPVGAVADLIEAINLANDEPATTTIKLICGAYTLAAVNNTLYGPTGLPFIKSEVVIEGNGAIIERRSGNDVPAFRLFTIAGAGDLDPVTNDMLPQGSLTLHNVWLRGGLAKGGRGGDAGNGSGGGGMGAGGAIYNRGKLDIESSTLSANQAQGGAGGNTNNMGWGAGGGGMGGNGASTRLTNGGAGGGGMGGNGGQGGYNRSSGGGGGGTITNGADGSSGAQGGAGGINNGGKGGDAGASGQPGGHGGFGGGGGGGGALSSSSGTSGVGGNGGLGGGGGSGGATAGAGAGGFGGGGGGHSNGGSGGAGGFGGGGGGGFGQGGFGGGSGVGGMSGGGGGAGLGGAVFNDGGELSVTNSTFSNNSALGGAAGSGGSGVTGGQGYGGAVFVRNGLVSINHATLNANTVKNGDNTAGAGGALYLLGDGATVYLDGAQMQMRPGDPTYLTKVIYRVTNSILANTANGATDAFVNTVNGGTATPSVPSDDANNLVEVNGTGANALPKVLVTADPKLDPELKVIVDCAPSQCHSPVHQLLAGSPAIDQTRFDERISDDQTGRQREPFDAFDIGAFEYCGPPISADNLLAALADPLACTGPNSLIVGSGSVTNPKAFSLTPVTLSITLPAQLTAIPGSVTCTFTPAGGTTTFCGLVGNQPTWMGTLGPMQMVTISYQARVAAGTPLGTTLVTTTSVNAGGVTVSTQSPPFVLNCPSAKLGTLPVNPGTSDQQAGSVLVFPYYTSEATGNFSKADTLITLTNVSNGAPTQANGTPAYAFLHLFFINRDCSPADAFICLTPNGSIQLRASEYDPLTSGYLIAVAVNAEGVPVQHNAFIGSAFVRDDTAGVSDSYNAEAFWKHSVGALTLDGDGAATLYFDGADYDGAPIQLATPIQDPNRSEQTLILASLSGDLGTRLNATAQYGAGAVYRDDEAVASFSNALGSGCLLQRAVTATNFRVAPGSLTTFLKDRYGYIKFNVTSPAVGVVLSRQGASGTGVNRFAGIRALHKTAVTAAALKLPVFTPFCN